MKIDHRALAGIAALAASAAFAQEAPLSVATPITKSWNLDPTISPDGKRMIFLKILEGREQLFIADIDGRNERQLSHEHVDIEDPAWSPDGKQLAFVRIEGAGKRNSMHLMDVATRATRRIGPADQSPIHPAWLRDGSAILYCTNDDLDPPRKNNSEIYRLDLATGKVTQLIAGGVNTFPVPSPDGRRVAFRKIIGDMNSEVFVADMNGANAANITKHESWEGWPSWSPDGKTIAFAGNRNAAWQIYLVNPDGSNLRLLAATEGRGTSPKWSPDGRTIYYTICRNSQERGGCEIYRAAVPADPA